MFGSKSILLIDSTMLPEDQPGRIAVDMIILSKNQPVHINELTNTITCRQIVADNSNATWKIAQWKQECEKHGVIFYAIADSGAFVMNLH